MKEPSPPKRLTRAAFFRESWRAIASLLHELLGDWLDVVEKAFPEVIRPPGAVAEGRFMELCTRCGACRQACPFFAIRPVLRPGSFDEGTPQIQPPETWCRMCPDFPCVRACPTGALRLPGPHPDDVASLPLSLPGHAPPGQTIPAPAPCPTSNSGLAPTALPTAGPPAVRIGLAEVAAERCLRRAGISCTACLTACPTRFRAVALPAPDGPPVIDPERCCGCGACGAACPAVPERAIRIAARHG